MPGLPFLLEVGSEEIPDWMIGPALEHLSAEVNKLLAPLGGRVSRAEATPRRLAIFGADVMPRQADSEEIVSGPPKAAPAGAVQGFARKMGVAVEALEVVATAKGEYYSVRRQVTGAAAGEMLAAALPGVITGIPWPKTMYWNMADRRKSPRFIRPIRWLVALLGDEVVPFEIAGVRAGDVTRGHRVMGRAAVAVTIGDYEERLRENGVVLAAADRERRIVAGIGGTRVKKDAALLHTLTHITEFPATITGEFDRAYLALPEEVLVTVMRHHQKYFAVENEDGSLAPAFVAVMNTAGDPEGLVRHGNERVLRARFNDARFFWEVDQKRPLGDRVEDLRNVTFQAKLGSYYAKTERNVALVRELGGDENAQRAALLAKTDLTCEMVKEFTELQGQVGGRYAAAQGEPEAVWRAIYDQYRPASMEDAMPATVEGELVSLADRVDTLRGCFGIGLIPTGSKDPFALRRAAQGVVRILVEGSVDLGMEALTGGDDALREFFLDRVRYYFRDVRGYPYDEVNAVLGAGWSNLKDVGHRLAALHAVRAGENFEPLAVSFKRIKNMLKQAGVSEGGVIEEGLLEAGPEAELHGAYVRVKGRLSASYTDSLGEIATLRPAVDLFFDKVRVDTKDEAVRRNRLTLLFVLLTEFSAIADFSEIVTQQQ
ncbi:MAG: glycine--tRNA ligase subunit beta [Acidobacteria bacterium]|nr:glycine--tRNA ligase subunit beta [Acidobacteriota bacterium]